MMTRSGIPDALRAMQSRRRWLLLATAVLAGACSSARVADTFTTSSDHPPPPADQTPPTVTGFGASGTRSPVTVTAFTATDDVGVTGYAITESATPPAASADVWSDAAPTTYATTSAGTVTLYPWAKDAAGNVSAAYGSPASVTLARDTTPPTVSGFTASGTMSPVAVSGFTATDDVAVTGFAITESATPPSASSSAWQATAPTTYLTRTIGSVTLYPWAKDAAGNVSAVFGSPPTLTLVADTTPPTVTVFTATGTIAPVTISFTATDNAGVAAWAITESATPPTAGSTVWQGRAPTSYWTATVGSVTLYPWAKDYAGNVSAPFASPVTLTLTAPPNRPKLGTNLNWCMDWDPEKLPADLMWCARPWAYMAGGQGNGDNVASWTPIDARGWPVVAANTAFGVIFEGSPWPGTYKLSFKNRSGTTGDTVTSYSGGSNITLTNRQHSSGTNITTYDVNVLGPATDQFIWLIWAGTTGGVTDVSLMRPLKDRSGWHAIGTPLADYIVDRLQWFSAIRTMQTQGGGSGKTTGMDKDWSDRTSPWGPQTRSRGSPGHKGGVAIENLVAMANQVDKDLWINVPFYATDDYITKMAQTIKCGSDGNAPWVTAGTSTCAAGDPTFKPLKPGLKLYVEYANEIWNPGPGYWEGENERAAGTAVCAQNDPYKLNAVVGTQGPNQSPNANCPNQANPGWGWRRTGYLAVRVSILFRAVFGDTEMITRIRPVLATQHARYATTVDPLRYIESVWGPSSPFDTLGNVDFTGTYTNPKQPVSYYLYAVATAPYTFTAQGFGDTSVGGLLSATVADFNNTTPGYITPAISDNAREASSRGLKLVGYEGGEGLIPELYTGGPTATAVTNSILASFDPTQGARMGASIDATSGLPLADQSTTVYGRLFTEWAHRGGDLFMHFTLGEPANGGSMFGLCAPTTRTDLFTVTGWSASMGTSSSDCRFEYGPKWDAVKAFSRAWGP